MENKTIGRYRCSGRVSCLGTMTWGRQNTEEEAFAQMDYAFDKGVNFFDTAELYPIPPEADTQGRTETMIGNWFEKTGKRQDVILATKVVGRSTMTWFRDNGDEPELTCPQIMEAIDKSLTRLKTDYIDLYQLHWPDRPLPLFGGLGYQHFGDEINRIEDTLGILDELRKSGKVRHFGLSNETPWGIMKFLHYAETKKLPRIVSVQNAYNFLNRIYELGGSEIYHRDKVGLLAYSPLAQGYLTANTKREQYPSGLENILRLGLIAMKQRDRKRRWTSILHWQTNTG